MMHAELTDRAVAWLRGTMQCGVVLTERGVDLEFPDAIGWRSLGSSVVVECKVSRADFLADQKKPHRASGMGATRFYLTPPALVGVHELPHGWGLLEARARVVKRVVDAEIRLQERNVFTEMRLLLSEVRRYQIHRITYPPLPSRADRLAAGETA